MKPQHISTQYGQQIIEMPSRTMIYLGCGYIIVKKRKKIISAAREARNFRHNDGPIKGAPVKRSILYSALMFEGFQREPP